jgi:hypothetical protein
MKVRSVEIVRHWKTLRLEHGAVENGRCKAAYNDLTKFPPDGRELIFQSCDLEARFYLMDCFEREYFVEDNKEGAGTLFHAEMYLKDRRQYELSPPPFKGAIPVEFFAQTEAIQ